MTNYSQHIAKFCNQDDHKYSGFTYHRNGGGPAECYWRECLWCKKIDKVHVHLPQDNALLASVADIVETVLSGQYGRDMAFDVAIQVLRVFRDTKGV